MAESILDSTKKALGAGAEYDVFDPDIIMHINSVFSILNQLGIGPEDGFMIEDDAATWDTFLMGDKRLNSVKTYVFLKVRLLFDPPPTAALVAAYEKQITELEVRLNLYREGEVWTTPVVVAEPE